MVVNEKDTEITNTFVSKIMLLQNYIFILGRAELEFSSLIRNAPDIQRFPTVNLVKTLS